MQIGLFLFFSLLGFHFANAMNEQPQSVSEQLRIEREKNQKLKRLNQSLSIIMNNPALAKKFYAELNKRLVLANAIAKKPTRMANDGYLGLQRGVKATIAGQGGDVNWKNFFKGNNGDPISNTVMQQQGASYQGGEQASSQFSPYVATNNPSVMAQPTSNQGGTINSQMSSVIPSFSMPMNQQSQLGYVNANVPAQMSSGSLQSQPLNATGQTALYSSSPQPQAVTWKKDRLQPTSTPSSSNDNEINASTLKALQNKMRDSSDEVTPDMLKNAAQRTVSLAPVTADDLKKANRR